MMGNARLQCVAVLAVLLSGGCSLLPGEPTPTTVTPSYDLLTINLDTESCTLVGLVSAQAACDCYDKMSYDQVAGRASQNLRTVAQTQYPDSDLLEISKVDLYLNNAVAHGVVYKCVADQI